MPNTPLQKIKQIITDGITWKANLLYQQANGSDREISRALDSVCLSISLITDDYIRTKRIDKVADIYKYKRTQVAKLVTDRIKSREVAQDMDEDAEESYRFPKFMKEEHRKEVINNGFTMCYEKGKHRATGIFVALNDNRIKQISNFVLDPLYLVTCQDPADNKQLFKVSSATKENVVVEFQRSSIISVERFSNTVHAKHNFMYSGNIDQLKMVMQYIGEKVPACEEVTVLGWQPEGFFAYPDKFYSDGNLIELNEYGIGEHRGFKYFSPSRSILHRNSREDDNIYQSLAPLNFKLSPVSYEEWAILMDKAYPKNGKFAIVYSFICLFRDIVLKKEGNCPHLYAWGAPGSGKSKMMESLTCLFYQETRSFQINSGTDFGLSRYVEVFRNCFNFINELDEDSVKPQWLQWIKGWYDNEARQRGTGKKNMTEVMKCNSAVGLAGQKIVNGDNNALPQRCIVLEFTSLEKTGIAPEQLKAFNTLKKYEENGGFNSVLTEVLAHREEVRKNFDTTFNEIFLHVRATIKQKDYKWHERIARNYCYLLSMAKIFKPIFTKLPFTYEEFFNESIEAIDQLATRITSTDVASGFWRIVGYLASTNSINNGFDYKIEGPVREVELYGVGLVKLEKPTRLLKVRLTEVHTAYLQHVKREQSQAGMNRSSLESYLKNTNYWLGPKNKEWFVGTVNHQVRKANSSCYVFNYDVMEEEGYFLDYESEKAHYPTHPAGDSQPSAQMSMQVTPDTKQEDLPF